MSDYFNQYQKATTSIKVSNLPQVAGNFKNSMLNYKYATNCGWYNDLVNAKSVKEIFDIFNIKFDFDKVNNAFIPVIKDVYTHANFKEVLKSIAPLMENGSIFAKDSYRYYLITFMNGEVKGRVRTITEEQEVKPVKQEVKPTKKETKKTSNKNKKFEFSATSVTPVTVKRDDNTYTVAELVRELLKQMDMGNASKKVKIEADFLFNENEKYA